MLSSLPPESRESIPGFPHCAHHLRGEANSELSLPVLLAVECLWHLTLSLAISSIRDTDRLPPDLSFRIPEAKSDTSRDCAAGTRA